MTEQHITLTAEIIRAYAKLAAAQRDIAYASADVEEAGREIRKALRAGDATLAAEARDKSSMSQEALVEASKREDAARREMEPEIIAQHLLLEDTFEMTCADIEAQL